MTLLKVTNISKTGSGGFVLRDVNLTQGKLEKIAIAGETGAGKSTLLKLIAGLIQPDKGEIIFEKKKVIGPDEQLIPGHPGIAYLSQHFELQKSLRVEQVLEYSNMLTDQESETLYDVCQIQHLLQRRTDQLSGGEKQRIAVCRLLISKPRLLLLDEPFSHLDMVHKNTLKSVIHDVGDKLKISCMLVSHDPLDTLSWADKIVVMREGQIVQKGSPEILYKQPVNEYAGGLFGKYNLIRRKEIKSFSAIKSVRKVADYMGDKAIFIRPEQFRIVKKGLNAVRGKVQKVWFFGSYCEADIAISKSVITIRTAINNLKEGAVVYVTMGSDELCLV